MLDWIAEQRIQAAMRAGVFDDLPGACQPLPADTLDPLVPASTRAAMRVIGNAGGVPVDILLRRELNVIEQFLDAPGATDATDATDAEVSRKRERRLEILLQLKRSL